MLQTRDTGVTHDPSSSSLTPLPTSNQSIGIYTSPKMSHIYLLLSISSATPVPYPTCSSSTASQFSHQLPPLKPESVGSALWRVRCLPFDSFLSLP